jgi:hypothetical protein
MKGIDAIIDKWYKIILKKVYVSSPKRMHFQPKRKR